MEKMKTLQENRDPGKVWTAQGVHRCRNKGDPLCKIGTGQGTRLQEIRPGQCSTENSKRKNVREETSAGTGRQQWHKKPRCGGTTASEEREKNSQEYRRMERKTPAMTRMYGKPRDWIWPNKLPDLFLGCRR
jgi:hypothetical protein